LAAFPVVVVVAWLVHLASVVCGLATAVSASVSCFSLPVVGFSGRPFGFPGACLRVFAFSVYSESPLCWLSSMVLETPQEQVSVPQ